MAGVGRRPGAGLLQRLETASGNPLFVTELLRALAAGVLVESGERLAFRHDLIRVGAYQAYVGAFLRDEGAAERAEALPRAVPTGPVARSPALSTRRQHAYNGGRSRSPM